MRRLPSHGDDRRAPLASTSRAARRRRRSAATAGATHQRKGCNQQRARGFDRRHCRLDALNGLITSRLFPPVPSRDRIALRAAKKCRRQGELRALSVNGLPQFRRGAEPRLSSYSRFKCCLAKMPENVRAATCCKTRALRWEHHMRYAASCHRLVCSDPACLCRGHAGDRSARIARRGPAMDLQLPRQTRLRPCPRRRARAVSCAKLQGAGECRHLSRLHRRRDRIEPGQGRATRRQSAFRCRRKTNG